MKETKSLEIRLWNETVGHIAKIKTGLAFRFDEYFKLRGREISPLEMPLATTNIYQSHERSQTYSSLPGVISVTLILRRWLFALSCRSWENLLCLSPMTRR